MGIFGIVILTVVVDLGSALGWIVDLGARDAWQVWFVALGCVRLLFRENVAQLEILLRKYVLIYPYPLLFLRSVFVQVFQSDQRGLLLLIYGVLQVLYLGNLPVLSLFELLKHPDLFILQLLNHFQGRVTCLIILLGHPLPDLFCILEPGLLYHCPRFCNAIPLLTDDTRLHLVHAQAHQWRFLQLFYRLKALLSDLFCVFHGFLLFSHRLLDNALAMHLFPSQNRFPFLLKSNTFLFCHFDL